MAVVMAVEVLLSPIIIIVVDHIVYKTYVHTTPVVVRSSSRDYSTQYSNSNHIYSMMMILSHAHDQELKKNQ